MTEAKEHWLNKFDWYGKIDDKPRRATAKKHHRRTCERHTNRFPHFILPIQEEGYTLDIHFVALFSKKPDAIPILLLHGWPGSFLEFLPILSLLKARYAEEEPPYHFIVPSSPGYAFSSPPPLDRDFRIEDVARVMNHLMVDLGFGSGYVVQGGDIGSKVARAIAAEHESCLAIHCEISISSTLL
jgi:microsomal epoxide hydrolase